MVKKDTQNIKSVKKKSKENIITAPQWGNLKKNSVFITLHSFQKRKKTASDFPGINL